MVGHFDGFEIHPIHEGDAWKICNFTIANADRLQTYLPKTVAQTLNPTLATLFVKKKVLAFQAKEEFLFTIKQIDSRELAGLIYLKSLDWNKKQGEFGYGIGYPFEGQGLMTKAIKVLSAYAFHELDLETLQIIVHKSNFPSIKVALNNGFQWQKTLKNEFKPIGKSPMDMELYELYKH